MESQRIVVGPEHADRMRAISAFYRLGMPGMTLVGGGIAAPAPKIAGAPLPQSFGICHYLLDSGAECGRRISKNKTRCGRCYLAAIRQVAESLTPELLKEYVKDMDGLDRLEVMATIRPYLKFELPPGGGTTI